MSKHPETKTRCEARLGIFHFPAPPSQSSARLRRCPLSGAMTTPIIAGASVAALALTGRAAILSFEAWRKAPPRMRRFYDGGFEPEMARREAALILGVRESAAKDKVLAAHRKVMIANHPDAGGVGLHRDQDQRGKGEIAEEGRVRRAVLMGDVCGSVVDVKSSTVILDNRQQIRRGPVIQYK